MAANESRIEAARRRLRIARYSIGAIAATAFALVGFAVRGAHPATARSGGSAASGSPSVSSDDDQSSSFSFDGGGSISPSSSFDTPRIQSGGS